MRRLTPILVVLGLAALAAVALAQVDDAPAARLTAVADSGSFEVTNSRDGQPIFAATNIAPGDAASGTVTIEDTGSAPATLTLHRGELVDTPGLGGGLLSDRLALDVVDVTTPTAPRAVYSGPLASMPPRDAGRLEPGEARTFEFTATLPEGGEASFQNAVQGASATVAYAWVAAEPGEGEEEEEGGGGNGGGEEGGGSEEGGKSPGGNPGEGGQAGAGGAPGAGEGANGGAGAVAGQTAVLDLTVPKIRRALRAGRVVVWANCDRSCRLTVRGRIRASASGHRRVARIRFAQKRVAAPGPQRLRIPIPRGLRRWLRDQPPPKRLRATLRFTAIGIDGQRDVARKAARLRIRAR
jgi:hypothetical protein